MKPNMADYEDRYRLGSLLHSPSLYSHTNAVCAQGLVLCESSVSNLVKDYDFVLDLAKFDESVEDLDDVVKAAPQSVRRRWRRPSLRRTFRPRRSRAQRRTGRRWGTCTRRSLTRRWGGDRAAVWQPAVDGRGRGKGSWAIATGKPVKLAYLSLQNNQIGRRRRRARGGGGTSCRSQGLNLGATRLAAPALPRCGGRQAAAARGLQTRRTSIGDAGVAALAEAAGKLPQLKNSGSAAIQIGDAGVASTRGGQHGKPPQLKELPPATTPTSPSKPRTPSWPPCPTVL